MNLVGHPGLLLSYAGCVGILMVDSGLGEILRSTFAIVSMKLLGKQFLQNVRVLQIHVEELLHPVSEKETHLLDVLHKASENSKTG